MTKTSDNRENRCTGSQKNAEQSAKLRCACRVPARLRPLTRVQALVRIMHPEMRRKLVRELLDSQLQLLHITVLGGLVELLEVMDDFADYSSQMFAEAHVCC